MNEERPARPDEEIFSRMVNDTMAKDPKVSELIAMREAAKC
jgi:hypothetical protein